VLFIDSDNAMGSRRGDVDDAFAIAALLRSGVPVAALASCRGNTSERSAYENNARIAAVLGWTGPVVRAAEARLLLASFRGRVRILALGPLTNITGARQAGEIILVGGNATSHGRWPPLWPFEFNLTHDRGAARDVFALDVPLTIVPLDVARTLTVERSDLDALPGPLGNYLRRGSERWFAHLRRVRLTRHFPVYDLAAALYALGEDGFTMIETTAIMRRNTSMTFGAGTRPVRLCVSLDRARLWERFLGLVATPSPQPQVNAI